MSGARRRADLCSVVQGMTDCIRHRGPDDAGVWVAEECGVALGFRRLAILDLTDAGHQPMQSGRGRFVIVFNGEIYNHAELRHDLDAQTRRAWVGHSDTETLLAGFEDWGVRHTLERAVGMFAIAAWDRDERRLFLARDRFGEKPLYYGWTRGAFVFGSELKALRRYPGFDNEIDRDAVALYMQYMSVPAPYSIHKGIYKLQPGCVLSVSADAAAAAPATAPFAPVRSGGLSIDRYWSYGDVVRQGLSHPIDDEPEALDQLETVLSRAVQLQSIADVPLGAFLSGGIDSSVLVALMQAQSAGRVKTFTIGFNEAGFNEGVYAKAVAQHLGTDHTELYLSAQQTRDVIPRLPDLYSEPFADSSQIPTHLVSQMARQQVTVALSGDGGDEMFGGYTRYIWGRRIWNQLSPLPPVIRHGASSLIDRVPVTAWDVVGNLLPGRLRLARLGDKAHKLSQRLSGVNTIDDLYKTLVTTWPADSGVVLGARKLRTVLDDREMLPELADAEHRMMAWDALTYLPDDILHKVDRASMGVSLETRAPFLDHRVAELAWRLPLHMKIRNGTGKWILRQLLHKHVPKALIERPKMGFGVPIDSWLRGPLREWAEDLLGESRLQSDGYLCPALIRHKWNEHLSGTRNWQNELWCVLMFQAWRESQ